MLDLEKKSVKELREMRKEFLAVLSQEDNLIEDCFEFNRAMDLLPLVETELNRRVSC